MTTTVKTWVNMRAGPDNAEPVVVVVSPDATVTVRACDLLVQRHREWETATSSRTSSSLTP